MKTLTIWFYKQIAIWAGLFKRSDVALEYWDRIRVLRPRDPSVLASIAHMHAEAGRYDTASALMRESLALDGGQAGTWFNLGYLQQRSERHDEAIASFDRAIGIDSKLDRAYYGKALSLIKTNRVEDAIPILRRNIELQPMSPFGFYQLAHAYNRLGERDKVAGTIRKLAAFEPKVAKQLEKETGVVVGIRTGF